MPLPSSAPLPIYAAVGLDIEIEEEGVTLKAQAGPEYLAGPHISQQLIDVLRGT